MGFIVVIVTLIYCAFVIVALVGVPFLVFLAIRSFRKGKLFLAWTQTALASLLVALPIVYFLYITISDARLEKRIQYESDKSHWPYQGEPK